MIHLLGLLLAVAMTSGSCAAHSHEGSRVAQADDRPGCVSECGEGYQCSSAVIQGTKTGLCIANPTVCASDADCANSAVVEGMVPLKYFCDKHSGAYPDKTGSAEVADRGTCMPTIRTGMDR